LVPTYEDAAHDFVEGVTRNGVGVNVISDDEADFEGLDAFARLTIGVLF
jgi:hypothetical protein